MKFFVAIALIVAVASAGFTKPTHLTGLNAEIQEIIAAINSPSTNPATAAALEQMLLDALGVQPEPVAVGPAIIDQGPISAGPAIIDFPFPDGDIIEASPVIIAPAPETPATGAPAATSAPLVQIILNINQAAAESSPIAPAPIAVPEPVDIVEPIEIIDNFPVVAPISPIVAEPVQVVDTAPVAVEPVIIGTPVLPSPAVILPEELN